MSERKALAIDKDGSLKDANEYGNISADQNALKEGRKDAILLKIS